MADCDSDSVHSGDSSVLLCIGEPFFGSLTNLDGFGKIRGRCTNPLHNCSCYVRFEHQLSFACLNCQGLCPAFSHVSGNDSVLWALNLELLFQYCGKYLLDTLYQFFKKTEFLVEFFFDWLPYNLKCLKLWWYLCFFFCSKLYFVSYRKELAFLKLKPSSKKKKCRIIFLVLQGILWQLHSCVYKEWKTREKLY